VVNVDNHFLAAAAKLSQLAYHDEISLYPFEMIQSGKTDTEVFVVKYSADVLYVIYRGTERCFKDIATDLKFKRKIVPFAGMRQDTRIRVHCGFAGAYCSVRRRIQGKIEDNKTNTVIHCGHSLGGALAQLSTLDGQYNFSDRKHVGVTFGQPAIGNMAFNRSFRKRIKNYYRFVNHFDFITWLPFTSLHSTRKIQLSTYGHDASNYVKGVYKWT